MICACGTELPGRRRVCDTCRAQSPSQVANRKGKRLDGTLRPSRERHNKGLRVDGTKRPSRQRHEAKSNGTRDKRRGEHTKLSRLERPFLMIDGEGAGEGARHEYLLLGSGDRMLQTDTNTPYPLDFNLCLGWLAATIPDDVEPFMFGGDYDVTMWLRSLPREKLVELMDREGRTDPKNPYRPRPVKAHGFEIDWLPGHFFWFRSPSGRTFRISDVRRFFGGSFIAALASQGIETPPWAVEMKRRRRQFTREEVLGSEVARYNSWERASGQEMMTRFRERCIAVGIVPRHWEGPGQGATAIMAGMGIKDHLSGGFER
jgi:hypothetical protein